MTCRFLENLTLASMVAPITDAAFRTQYWERKPLVIHRGAPDFYDGLFTLRDFDAALMRAPSSVKTAEARTEKNAAYKVETVAGLEGVLGEMREGGTLILDAMHRQNANLGLLCGELSRQLGHTFQTNLYLTPAHGQGFTAHWDNHDVFILQVMGSKNWNIEKDRRAFPGREDSMTKDQGRELRGELMSFTLEQGDLIYIPRGFVHAAECGDEPSLHITLGLLPIGLDDFLHAAIKAQVIRDERTREALPLGFMQDSAGSVAKSAARVLRAMGDDPEFLALVYDQYRDELVRRAPLDVGGQVAGFFKPVAFTTADLVGPRRGAIFRMHAGADSVRVNFGTRSIVFPGIFKDAVAFALNNRSYRIGDIPGDLEDEERIALVERLVEEGLVVRTA
jgi:ribosomal protein L16 Arg81 hydroxylase